ncbi:hypothetical protein [Roseivivax sp. THAF30]|uniref:hypothetical protein n=1 Tax=Roseivivax sp. THAF30 TaxID=2587852 RepID=UPI001268177A|nr:hypothetical protein [Roseivivax sp. THAF30]QFT64571.1 hypothetical protein FIU91_16660 [Roseivivax sp. THAF30]
MTTNYQHDVVIYDGEPMRIVKPYGVQTWRDSGEDHRAHYDFIGHDHDIPRYRVRFGVERDGELLQFLLVDGRDHAEIKPIILTGPEGVEAHKRALQAD